MALAPRRILMRFTTDHCFVQGSLHARAGKPAQDYAISGVREEGAFAIVSDGCSGGRETDVGARIISLSMRSAIEDNLKYGTAIGQRCLDSIRRVKNVLDLWDNDLLATCVYAVITPTDAHLRCLGDGAYAFLYQHGNLIAGRFEWDNSMPAYPIYLTRLEQQYQFIANHTKELSCTEYRLFDWGGETHDATPKFYTADAAFRGVTVEIPDRGCLAAIAVFSDGVALVDGMDWQEVVRQLMAFKSFTGEFAKRRMLRFVESAQKVGKGPQDDLAYAVIRVDNE